jgi:hypothetical protein
MDMLVAIVGALDQREMFQSLDYARRKDDSRLAELMARPF